MAEDREMLRKVWDGKLPVCFTMAQEDIVITEQPDKQYVCIDVINDMIILL